MIPETTNAVQFGQVEEEQEQEPGEVQYNQFVLPPLPAEENEF
jgi:hypothetical protein